MMGMLEVRIRSMMLLMDSIKPPGVSSSMIRHWPPWRMASSIESVINLALAGLMILLTSMRKTGAAFSWGETVTGVFSWEETAIELKQRRKDRMIRAATFFK